MTRPVQTSVNEAAGEVRGPSLRGRTIGVLQARHQEVVAGLIRRAGGVPLLAACLKEVPAEERRAFDDALGVALADPIDLAIFQTGVGAAAIFDAASRSGLDGRIRDRLAAATVLARGPKPASVLRKQGVRIDLRTDGPHTTAETLHLLDGFLGAELPSGYRVVVQHYGAENRELVDFLRTRRATVVELAPYSWALPDDREPVHRLLEALERREVDSVAFSSAAQVENLFVVAAQRGCADQLGSWLRERTAVAALGPATAAALRERGVTPVVMPVQPKMVPFVQALADHFGVTAAPPRRRS